MTNVGSSIDFGEFTQPFDLETFNLSSVFASHTFSVRTRMYLSQASIQTTFTTVKCVLFHVYDFI